MGIQEFSDVVAPFDFILYQVIPMPGQWIGDEFFRSGKVSENIIRFFL